MSCRNKKQIFWDNLRAIQKVKQALAKHEPPAEELTALEWIERRMEQNRKELRGGIKKYEEQMNVGYYRPPAYLGEFASL